MGRNPVFGFLQKELIYNPSCYHIYGDSFLSPKKEISFCESLVNLQFLIRSILYLGMSFWRFLAQ